MTRLHIYEQTTVPVEAKNDGLVFLISLDMILLLSSDHLICNTQDFLFRIIVVKVKSERISLKFMQIYRTANCEGSSK